MSNENGNSFTSDVEVNTTNHLNEQNLNEQLWSNSDQETIEEAEKVEAFEESAEEPVEEPVEEPTEEPKEDKFASRFAALSRKEKELRQREKQVESRLAELEEKLSAKQEPEEVSKEPELPLEYRLKKDPLKTLSELGIGYEKLTQIALNDGKLDTDMQMQLMREEIESQYKQELDSLREEYLNDKKAAEEEKYQQTLNSFMNELTEFVNSSEEFELVKANDGIELVYDIIEEHYKETGEILDNATAAKLVEDHYEQELKKLAKSKKLKSMLQPQEEAQRPNSERQKSPTLSNTMSARVSTKGAQRLSEDESKAAAAQLLKWVE